MDRSQRLVHRFSPTRRPWIRAGAVAAAVAACGLGMGAAIPLPALAQVSGTSMSVPLAANAPQQYVVKKGDTLWDIAGVFLRDPWYWPEIWHVNPEIQNPHLIYPGDVLNLVYVDGKPRITVGSAGSTRLSPQVRSEPLDDAVRAIPYDLLMDFVGRPTLIEKDQLRRVPYVVGMRDRHIIGSTANEVYAAGLGEPPTGARYTIVNIGDKLVDPDDGDLLGYLGHWAGTGEVVQTTGAVVPGSKSIFDIRREEPLTHLRVQETGREIMQGDKVFPARTDIGDDFVPSAPGNPDVIGQVIAVVDGVYVAGRYQVLAVNRGKRHGLVPGNTLGVFYRGEEVRDRFDRGNAWMDYAANYSEVRLPDERSATLLLFQVYDRMSYGLVMESTQVIRRGDFVASPRFGHRDELTQDYAAR
jgi:hypothetical protein